MTSRCGCKQFLTQVLYVSLINSLDSQNDFGGTVPGFVIEPLKRKDGYCFHISRKEFSKQWLAMTWDYTNHYRCPVTTSLSTSPDVSEPTISTHLRTPALILYFLLLWGTLSRQWNNRYYHDPDDPLSLPYLWQGLSLIKTGRILFSLLSVGSEQWRMFTWD